MAPAARPSRIWRRTIRGRTWTSTFNRSSVERFKPWAAPSRTWQSTPRTSPPRPATRTAGRARQARRRVREQLDRGGHHRLLLRDLTRRDRFGRHSATGPDVDQREGHVFLNNLLSTCAQPHRARPPPPPPLVVWSPAATDNCVSRLPSLVLMASDAFIHAGFNAMKTLSRSTPDG